VDTPPIDPTPEAPAPAEPAEQECYIQVHTHFFVLAFLLLLCTPRIQIDGVEHKRRWGRHRFDVSPGAHEVTVWFPYLFFSECGKNTVDVDAVPGAPEEVDFNMPPWMLAKGKMTVGPATEAALEGAEADEAAKKKTMMIAGISAAIIIFCCCCGGVGGALLGSM
jgi:hypothetical protein